MQDTHLATSYARADEKFEEEVKKLQVKKWKDVSLNLERILGKRKYSAKACKERHEANELGTALLPIELDPDPEGRRILRDDRRKAARELRAEQMEMAARKASGSRRTDAEKQRARDEKERQHLLEKHKRDALKAQLAQIRRDRADALVRKREARQIARDRYRLESEWQRAKANAERTIYKNLTGKYLLGLRPSRSSSMHQHDVNESAFFTDPEVDPDEADDENVPVGVDSDDADEMLTSKQCLQVIPRTLVPKIPVSKETLCNARSVMSMAELEVILHERGLRRRAPREQHAQLVARLAYEDTQLTSAQLSELLGRYFDKGKGSKMSKYRRLQEHNAKHSANGEKGITAADPDFMKGYEGYADEFRYLLE
nr:hypothetical protein CFP56_20257 [Quercus suber]